MTGRQHQKSNIDEWSSFSGAGMRPTSLCSTDREHNALCLSLVFRGQDLTWGHMWAGLWEIQLGQYSDVDLCAVFIADF